MSLLQPTESSLKSNYAFQGGTGGEGEFADREEVVGSFLFYFFCYYGCLLSSHDINSLIRKCFTKNRIRNI